MTQREKKINSQFAPADKQIQYPQRAKRKKVEEKPLPTGICGLKLLESLSLPIFPWVLAGKQDQWL